MIIKFHSEFGENIENDEHRRWHEIHQEELEFAEEYNTCPSCGAELHETDILYDYGFKCGIACENCV